MALVTAAGRITDNGRSTKGSEKAISVKLGTTWHTASALILEAILSKVYNDLFPRASVSFMYGMTKQDAVDTISSYASDDSVGS